MTTELLGVSAYPYCPSPRPREATSLPDRTRRTMQENEEPELCRQSTPITPSRSLSTPSPSLSSPSSASPASEILWPLSSRIVGPAAIPSSGSLVASLTRRRSGQRQNSPPELMHGTNLPAADSDPIAQFTRLAWHSTKDNASCSSPEYLPSYASVFSDRIELLAVFQRQYTPVETRETIQKYAESVQFFRREEDGDGGSGGRVWKRRVIEFR